MKLSVRTFRTILLEGTVVSMYCSIVSLVVALYNGIPMPNAVGLPLAFLILAGYFALGFYYSKKHPPSFLKKEEVNNPW